MVRIGWTAVALRALRAGRGAGLIRLGGGLSDDVTVTDGKLAWRHRRDGLSTGRRHDRDQRCSGRKYPPTENTQHPCPRMIPATIELSDRTSFD